MITAFEADSSPAPAPSTDRQSQHDVDMAYIAFLEAQFKKHPKSIGAGIIFGTDLPMGAITRSPPYLGSSIIEVGMSTAETDSSLDSGSPVNIIQTTHALRGCSLYSELYWIRTLGLSLLE
jgi:hypothetical protein